jgi:hypothetical protein
MTPQRIVIALCIKQFQVNGKYRVVFNELDAFTAPRFTATGPPPAAERTRILPMTQHADNIWNEGKFFVHKSQEVLKVVSLYT